jgi:hypothetical protein
MKNINEIKDYINECFYLINRIKYQNDKIKNTDKSHLKSSYKTYEENKEYLKKYQDYTKKLRLRKLKIK